MCIHSEKKNAGVAVCRVGGGTVGQPVGPGNLSKPGTVWAFFNPIAIPLQTRCLADLMYYHLHEVLRVTCGLIECVARAREIHGYGWQLAVRARPGNYKGQQE
jgi:hypothetical protein